ncbi:MAG: corrinoid protein [Acidobacteria bacterium]|jgi:5-methyltetrahydrofolate--homocysteine methyltransferase|nr:corrinoid protein [Acidobacteriota bacterium]
MDILKQIADSLQKGDDPRVGALAAEALEKGIPAGDVLQDGLIAGMNVVGEQFRLREIFLPDVLLAARAMYAGLEILRPHLAKEGVPLRGKVVLGTIKGDLHDIGKNLVGIMLKGAGFEVIDLGHDVAPEAFVDAAVREEASLIGMSALLTTTMTRMREVVDLVESRGLSGQIKTIVGGAPLSPDFAREIGADDYASDGATAVERVKALLGVT